MKTIISSIGRTNNRLTSVSIGASKSAPQVEDSMRVATAAAHNDKAAAASAARKLQQNEPD